MKVGRLKFLNFKKFLERRNRLNLMISGQAISSNLWDVTCVNKTIFILRGT